MTQKDKIGLTDRLTAVCYKDGKLVGYSESKTHPRTVYGDVNADGHITMSISGTPAQGENDTLKACSILVAHLNNEFSLWKSPEISVEDHIDATCKPISETDGYPLLFQVVRAVSDRSVWKSLAQNSAFNTPNMTLEMAAKFLSDSISKKQSRIPESKRNRITLVLNALDTPALCFNPVIDTFQKAYGAWARSLHFNGIWIVGPTPSMCILIDSSPA